MFGDLVGTVKVDYSSAQTGTHDITLDANAVEGNLIVICHFSRSVGSSPDTNFTQAVEVLDGPNTDAAAIHYKVAGAAEGDTFGATPDGDGEKSCVIGFEIEGPFDASPLDKTASDGPNAGAASQTTGTTDATTQNDEVAIGFIAARNTGFAICPTSWDNSFTVAGCSAESSAECTAAYKTLSSTGAVESTGTFDDTPSDSQYGMVATFKKTVAGGLSVPVAMYHRKMAEIS